MNLIELTQPAAQNEKIVINLDNIEYIVPGNPTIIFMVSGATIPTVETVDQIAARAYLKVIK